MTGVQTCALPIYKAKSHVEVTGEARKEVEAFLGDIDDCDDVHRVYAGIG